jgi:hypothetical protein
MKRRGLLVAILAALILVLPSEAQEAASIYRLQFGMSVDSEELVEWFNANARFDDMAGVIPENIHLLDGITGGRKLVMFPSIAEAEEVVPGIAEQIDIVGYNPEHWPLTPDDEQADLVAAAVRGRVLADAYGLEYALGPDLNFLDECGAEMGREARPDYLAIQLQTCLPVCAVCIANKYIPELQEANPGMGVSVVLKPSGDNNAELMEIVVAVGGDVESIGMIRGGSLDDLSAFLAHFRRPYQYMFPTVKRGGW